jgi:hypothetical protein
VELSPDHLGALLTGLALVVLFLAAILAAQLRRA